MGDRFKKAKPSAFPTQRSTYGSGTTRIRTPKLKAMPSVGGRLSRSSEFDNMIAALLSLPDDQLAVATGSTKLIKSTEIKADTPTETEKSKLKIISVLSSEKFQERSTLPSVPQSAVKLLDNLKIENHQSQQHRTNQRKRKPAINTQLKLVDSLGAYPLATPERVHAATIERLEKERIARERKDKADELKARFQAKKKMKEEKEAAVEDPLDYLPYDYDLVDSSSSSSISKFLRDKNGKVSFKKAGKLVRMLNMSAKPPEQKAKHELKALKSAANKATLSKLLFSWATVQRAFRVPVVSVKWPTLPPGEEAHVPTAPPLHETHALAIETALKEAKEHGAVFDEAVPPNDEPTGGGGNKNSSQSSAAVSSDVSNGVGEKSTTGDDDEAHKKDGDDEEEDDDDELEGEDESSQEKKHVGVPYNFKGGIRGVVSLRDLFGLLTHGIKLTKFEQRYVVDKLLKLEGASAIYATNPDRHLYPLGHEPNTARKSSRFTSPNSSRKSSRRPSHQAVGSQNSSKQNLLHSPTESHVGGNSSHDLLKSPIQTGSGGGGGGGGHSRFHKRLPPSGLSFEGAPTDSISSPPTPYTGRSDHNGGGIGTGDDTPNTEGDDEFCGGDLEIGVWSTLLGLDHDHAALAALPESSEYVKLQSEKASKHGLPSVISYKEFFDAVKPDDELIKELIKDLKTQADFLLEKSRKKAETQIYLVEQQALKREPLVAELSRKLMYPPTCEKHKPADGRGPTVTVGRVYPFNTRTRAKQLRALMLDGGMVLKLMHSSGGLGEVLASKTHAQSNDGQAHVPLSAGRPHGGVIQVVVAAAKYGMGLQGLSPAECVETLWIYCAERIQASFRGEKPRKREGGALRMWMAREMQWKRRCFKAWWNAAMNTMSLRYRCNGPFKSWFKYTQEMKKLHHLFAKCFWPLYIWRKVTRESILEKQKGDLLRRLYWCYSSLHVFRAWKKYAMARVSKKRLCDNHYLQFMMKKRKRTFFFWRRYCHRKKGIERSWLRRGMRMHDDKDLELMWRAVVVWRYWRMLHKTVHIRANQYWRVVSADRERMLTAARAEARARRKNRRRRDKTPKEVAEARAKEALDHAEAFKNFPTLPKLKQLSWANELPNEFHILCGKLIPHMEKELIRECGQRHMMFWREGPKFFDLMRGRVLARRKKAQALRVAARGLLLKTIEAWRLVAKKISEERMVRRREREMESKVASQRSQALSWAKKQGNEALVRSLEAEEAAAKMAKLMRETAKRDRLEELDLSDSEDDDERIDREIRKEGEAAAAEAAKNKVEKEDENNPPKPSSSLENLGSAIVKGKAWKKKSAEMASKHASMLDSDRAARKEQGRRYHKVMEEMRRRMTSLHKARAGYADEQADWQSDVSEDKAKLQQFFQDEADKMDRACAREIKYVSEIKIHMARKIYKLLTSVRAASEKILDYLICWHYFRRLRMPYFLKKTKSMKNRMILRNRLRLCSRLRYMMKGAPLYRGLRVKWKVFNCWLLMIENHYKMRTPGLKHHVRKLAIQGSKYHQLLQSRGVTTSAYAYSALNPLTTDTKACFLRWCLYTTNSVANRGVNRLVAWRRRMIVLRTFFRALAEVSLGRNAHQRTLDKAAAKAAYEKEKAEELAAAIKAASLDNESEILDPPSRENSPRAPGAKSEETKGQQDHSSSPSSSSTPGGGSRTGTPNKKSSRRRVSLSNEPPQEYGHGTGNTNSPSLSTNSMMTDGITFEDSTATVPNSIIGGGGGDIRVSSSPTTSTKELTSILSTNKVPDVEAIVMDPIQNDAASNHPESEFSEGQAVNFPDSAPSTRPQSRSAEDEIVDHGLPIVTPVVIEVDELTREKTAFEAAVGEALEAPLVVTGVVSSGLRNPNVLPEKFNGGYPFSAKVGKCLAEKRVLADLHCWRNGYLSPQSHWLSTSTKRANSKRCHVVKHGARDGPSFRSFIGGMHQGAMRRVALERVLLLDAFINRGKLGFRDYSLLAQPTPHQATSSPIKNKTMQNNNLSMTSNDSVVSTIVIGEDNFVDHAVWGGFQISEVNVFSEPGHGIFGICLAVAGDGNGSTELLPKGGVMSPHGQSKGQLLNFKLKHPYEHISEVTLYISTVIEAIQFHTRAPDGKKIRSSPLLGSPFSPDVREVKLSGEKPTDTLVGFNGRYNQRRLTALGLQMREITSPRTVFSCSWTPSLISETTQTLATHSQVLAVAKTAKLAQMQDEAFGGGGGGGGGRRRQNNVNQMSMTPGGAKEQWRVAIEKGAQAEVDALRGDWESYTPTGALRTDAEEKVQVAEFMALLRMRTGDVGSATVRSENLARRMWSGNVCSAHSSFHSLRKLSVITGISRWYFNALAFSLTKEVKTPAHVPDHLEIRGKEYINAAHELRINSDKLRHKALTLDAAPRAWATEGMRTPQDREKEAKFKEQLSQWHVEVEELRAKSERYQEEGEGFLSRAFSLRPALPSRVAAHMYYKSRLELARTQRKMEEEFGRDYFTKTLNSVALHGSGSKSKLTKEQLRRLIEAIDLEPEPSLRKGGGGL